MNDAVRSLCSIEPTCNVLNCNKKLNFSKTLKKVEKNISKKINNFQTVLTLCSLAISNVFSFLNICSAFNINSAKRPFITMQVQGVTSSWLFDTGPAASVMALSEFRKISPDNWPEKLPAMLNLSTASADSLNIVGVYNLSFSMKGKTIQNPVYVCSNINQKAIIGMDVIKKFGLIYSLLKETFHFEDTPINSNYFFQPKMPPNRSAVASLTVVKTVKIPPLTSVSLSVSSLSSDHYRPPPGMLGLAHIGTPSLPYLNGGPGLVEINRLGEVTV